MALMGLDIGTSGCKCTIFDYSGNVLSYAYKEYPMEVPKPTQYELNPNLVWNSVKEIISKASKMNKEEKIDTIGVSSLGEAVVPVDDKGRVLYNSILCSDSRGSEQIRYLCEKVGRERIMELTGLPVNAMFSLPKIMWMKENMGDVFKRTKKFLLFEDFIIHRLTGNIYVDYSLASRTMAFNTIKKKWEPVMLEAAGIDTDADIFSKAVGSGKIVGTVKKSVAEELGISVKTLVVTGGHDQACTALGAGIIKGDMAVDGMGTAECITATFKEALTNTGMLKNNFSCGPHVVEGMYLTLAFILSGGGLLKWYRDNFALYELQESKTKGVNVYRILDEKASGEPTSLLVLPHFSGSGTPYMDSFSKGAILGLTLDADSSQLYRALMEGISYEMKYNLECLACSGISVKRLRAVGGGARSELWLQIKADIFDMEVETLLTEEAGALGAAILAGIAAGIYSSETQAAEMLVKPGKVYYPNKKHRKVVKYIEENFCDPNFQISLVAEHFSVSAQYLRSVFKEQTGQTISSHVNKLKIEKAKELLCCTRDTVNEIVQKIGNTDISSFTRKFKQETGMTPGRFRELFREPEN